MSNNRWLTKEDILNDLAEVTGTRVVNIDDRFAVRGECPPPINVSDEIEDEFVQMYGQHASKDSKIPKPDLFGITQMLRMVNDYYDTAIQVDDKNINELKKTANTVITISKLDPNVKDFCPRNLRNRTNVQDNGDSSKPESPDCLEIRKSTSKSLDVKHLVCNEDDEISETDTTHKKETNNKDIDVTKKIDVSSLNSNDIKDITEILKKKICGTAKAQCLKKKRERNLAIASLLKLYSDVPRSPENTSPLKLMTPEYFESLPRVVPSNTIGIETKETVTEQNLQEKIKMESVDQDVTHMLSTMDPVNDSTSNPKITSRESIDTCGNEDIETNIEKQSNDLLMSKEVAESVKKVHKWFNGPEKKKHKSRAVFFGPVTFKRKETDSVNSSETRSPSVKDNLERPSSVQAIDSFVPSAYANELTKSYMERVEAKVVQNEDIWTALEKKLQERDKTIKERLLSSQAQKQVSI